MQTSNRPSFMSNLHYNFSKAAQCKVRLHGQRLRRGKAPVLFQSYCGMQKCLNHSGASKGSDFILKERKKINVFKVDVAGIVVDEDFGLSSQLQCKGLGYN